MTRYIPENSGSVLDTKTGQRWWFESYSGAIQVAALLAIRDMPMPEQDNMLSANMRKIASDALSAESESNRTEGQ